MRVPKLCIDEFGAVKNYHDDTLRSQSFQR